MELPFETVRGQWNTSTSEISPAIAKAAVEKFRCVTAELAEFASLEIGSDYSVHFEEFSSGVYPKSLSIESAAVYSKELCSQCLSREPVQKVYSKSLFRSLSRLAAVGSVDSLHWALD